MPLATISPVVGRIDVQTSFNEKELIKRVPGAAYDGTRKTWHVPLTWPACIQLRGVFGVELKISPELNDWARAEKSSRVTTALELRALLEPIGDHARYTTKLFPFQHAGVDFIEAGESVLIGDEMGTGKTIQALESLSRGQQLYGDSLPALVICPNSTKTNWAREVGVWYPAATPYVIGGSLKQRRDALAKARRDPMAIVIINIEGVRGHSRLAPYGSVHLKKCAVCDKKMGDPNLSETRCEVHPKELNGFGFKTVILDEAHRIKESKSLQTRACWAVGHDESVQRRWALTGTPIANDPSELWSIMHFLEPQEYPRRTAWIERYCLQAWNGFGGLSVVGIIPEHREEFFNVLNPRFRRMTKALVLPQLPPKIRTTVKVQMSVKQAKAYHEIESGLVTRLENGQLLVARSNLAAQIRLLQLAGSYCTIEQETLPLHVTSECPCYGRGLNAHAEDCGLGIRIVLTPTDPSPKIDALEEIIDQAGGKQLVVCAEQRKLIELAAKRLTKKGVKYGLITGKVDQWDRKKALDDLDAGRIQVLMFTSKAGGTGLNMTAADTIVYLQQSWSMIENKQSEDRVHRIGSEKHESIHVITIITEDTIEEAQTERYLEKLRRLDEITRDRAVQLAAGLATTELDQLEAQIMGSYLGDPT